MPLDTFVPAPVMRMKVVDDPDRIMPVHERLQESSTGSRADR